MNRETIGLGEAFQLSSQKIGQSQSEEWIGGSYRAREKALNRPPSGTDGCSH